MFHRLVSALMVLSCLSIPAYAKENACNSTAIVQLADYVLASRAEAFSGLAKRNYGSTALYLKIVYGDMQEEEATKAVVELFEENVRDADQLASAYLITRYGYAKAVEMLGPDFAPRFEATQSNISLARAIMLSGGSSRLFDSLARNSNIWESQSFADPVVALLDQPDEIKLRFAREAESKKLHLIAAGFLLARSDLGEWEDFQRRYPGIRDWGPLLRTWRSLPLLNGHPMLSQNDGTELKPHDRVSQLEMSFRLAADKIVQLEFQLAEPPLLSRLINHTGEIPGYLIAANNLRPASENERRKLGPRLEVDRLALFLDFYYAVREKRYLEGDLQALRSQLERPFRTTLREEFDWLIGASTIHSAIMRNTWPEVPPAPISEDFAKAWPIWLESAELIESGKPFDLEGLTPMQRAIAAELLFILERDTQLLSGFENARPDALLVRLANDFAIRLDRACEAYLTRTGSNLYLTSVPMYRFDGLSE